ncbi:hypothetical protein NQ314_019544 [Rhamnusium bicolor]|uniref:Uncharacterized protein n=1 Tax=Rhamnusium bicolor TaxID=1586634 RepID=A0AAV8WN43_9CUCU|nr:hypothetical protein NQ314_019544 [Rhamnusium bicolor]
MDTCDNKSFRLKEFDDILQQDVIDLSALKKIIIPWWGVCIVILLLFSIIFLLGIPDDQGKRSLCWRLLLNYLPPEQQKWKFHLQEKRNLYKQFIGT